MDPRRTLLGYEPVDATGRDTEEDREAEWITPDVVEFSKFDPSGRLRGEVQG
jgi:hypothetical protein